MLGETPDQHLLESVANGGKKDWLRRRGAHTNGLTREQGKVTW